jgi:hypothetical protein
MFEFGVCAFSYVSIGRQFVDPTLRGLFTAPFDGDDEVLDRQEVACRIGTDIDT